MHRVAPAVSSSPSVGAEQNGPKLFSCATCKQRKVKCNRSYPCSNCLKAGTTCKFVPPAPSQRRKRKAAREGLHARLGRYERILQSYGVKIDASSMQARNEESPADDEMEIMPGDEIEMETIPEEDALDDVKAESPVKDKLKQAKLVSQRGNSRYIEKYAGCFLCGWYDSMR